MNEALQALEIKVENGGATPQGKFFAKDWNTLVEAVKQLDLAEFDEAALNKYLKDNGYITSDDIPSTDLSDLVTLSTEQTIPGAKNFTGGIKVNGQPLIHNAEKGYWELVGDLIVSGAITMFGSSAGFKPSTITDGVVVDGVTIVKTKDAEGNWQLTAIGGGGSGSGGGLTAAEVNALITNALKPYALSSSVPTDNKQLSNGAGYITAAALSGLATEQYVTTRGYITSDALAGYATISSLLGYATEQWVGDNYLASSNFTKANIKSTLGISDWALAATKPSYTAAEVGALAISGGSVSSDDYQPLFVNSNFSSGIEDVRIAIAHNWNVKGLFNWESNGVGLRMYNTACGSAIGIKDDGTPYYDSYNLIHSGNIGSYNAGSATKLQTARTIWGQSFDGTGNVSGTIKNVDVIRNSRSNWIIGEASLDGEVHIGSASFAQARTLYNANGMLSLLANGTFRLLRREDTPPLMHSILTYEAAPYGLLTRINTDGSVSLQAQREANDAECFRLLLNPLGGNVAVGGATADARLHVHGDIRTTGSIAGLGNNGGFVLLAGARDGEALAIERMSSSGSWVGKGITMLNNGNVAIGETSADAKLHIYGDILSKGSMRCIGDYGGYAMYAGIRDGEALAIERLNSSGSWVGMGVTLLNNGDVGIGYTTPQAKLHVGGEVKAELATLSSNNSCNLILNSNAQSVTFATLQIDNVAKGYVGYSKDGVFLQNGTASWAYITVSDDGKFVTSCDAIINGNLLATGAITMFSQLSMKNVIDYDGLSLAQLAQIRPARFTWKDGRDNRTHVGCIADYIQPILPEVVYETVNKELTVDYGSAAFYVGASLIKPVVELWNVKDNHEKRIVELERENKRKGEVIAILQNKLNQLSA